MKKKARILVALACTLALVAAFALAGCSSGDQAKEEAATDTATEQTVEEATVEQTADETTEPAATDVEAVELQVFAANSLTKAMDEAQQLYTQQYPNVTFADSQYDASGTLNEKLGSGAYADLEITASKGTLDTAVEEGYVDEGTRFDMFTNELVIIAKTGSGYNDVTLQEIADGTYTVCVGDDSVPAGNYAAQALSTVGAYEATGEDAGKTGSEISGKEGSYVGINPVTVAKVGDVCSTVAAGDENAQVGIVYSSDVYRFDGVEIVGIIPDDTHKAIIYPGAVCTGSKYPAEAEAFLTWCVTDPDAQRIWNDWGFELAQ